MSERGDHSIAVGRFDVTFLIVHSKPGVYSFMRGRGIASEIIDNGGKLVETDYYRYVTGHVFKVKKSIKTIYFALSKGLGAKDNYIGGQFSPHKGMPVIEDKPYFKGYRYLNESVGKVRNHQSAHGFIEVMSEDINWKLEGQPLQHQEHHVPGDFLQVPDFDGQSANSQRSQY